MKSIAAVFVMLFCSTPLSAQSTEGPTRVAGLAGGSFLDGGNGALFGASVSHRLSSWFGVELELSYIRGLELTEEDQIPVPLAAGAPIRVDVRGWQSAAGPLLQAGAVTALFGGIDVDSDARMLAYVANAVFELPSPSDRLRPFVVGGGGVAHVREEIAIDFPDLRIVAPAIFPPRPFEVQRGETDLALNAGGGADVQLWHGLTVGGDVRYLRLVGSQRDLDLVRVTSRVGVRF
jgi:opacity protein-like surface antigen